jgi:hypothetical protein
MPPLAGRPTDPSPRGLTGACASPGRENDAVPPASPSPDAERGESPLQRLDRNTVELLNELRVAATGIQVLFGFLLVVPFNARFPKLSHFERGLYLLALVCVATSTILLIAPTVMHRLLFRGGQKSFLVAIGTRLMVFASVFLGLGMTTIVLLVCDLVAGIGAAIALAASVAVLIVALWFIVPLRQRGHPPDSAEEG